MHHFKVLSNVAKICVQLLYSSHTPFLSSTVVTEHSGSSMNDLRTYLLTCKSHIFLTLPDVISCLVCSASKHRASDS